MESVFQAGQTLLQSEKTLWTGITIREKILPPMQTGPQLVTDHLLMTSVGQAGVGEWRTDSDKWHWKMYPTGCVSMVPHGNINDARWDKQAQVVYISLAPTVLHAIFDTDQIELNQIRAVSDPTIRHIILALHRELNLHDYAGQLYGESMTMTLATHLVTAYSLAHNKRYAPPGKFSAAQLLTIIDYSRSHLDEKIGLAELAQITHMSRFHFARLFKHTLGISPYQYLLGLKMDKAKHYIRHNQHAFGEIAHLLGFADQAHFANAFKKATGQSPSGFYKT